MVVGRGTQGPGVLVVEDYEAVARGFCNDLRRAGFRADAVGSVAEARVFFAKRWDERCVAILLDLQLGEEDGAALLPDIEALRPAPHVAVVSGTADGPRAVALLERGIPTIPKPIGGMSLGILVAQLIARPALSDPVGAYCGSRRLSLRETELVRATADGLETAAASVRVGCSPHTLTTYWQRIFRKTGHRSQPAVLAAIIRFALAGRGMPSPQ
jgi:two-component system response regulator RegA